MATAFKCDRCKKLFEPHKSSIVVASYIHKIKIYEWYVNNHTDKSKSYDLCPDCMHDLEKWLTEYYGDTGYFGDKKPLS